MAEAFVAFEAQHSFADVETFTASARPKSVLIYAINYAPELIGCGRYTGEIGAYLVEHGTFVDVVTAPPHYPEWAVRAPYKAGRYAVAREPRHRITRCPIVLRRKMGGLWRMIAPFSFALSSAPVVLWRALTTRPETIFAVEPTLFAAPIALLAAKLSGARAVLHVQDLEVDAAFAVGHLKGGLVQKLAAGVERWVLDGFDQIVTISGKMQERLLAKGVKPDRVTIVRNWVDTSKIYPMSGPNRFRAELDIPPDRFVALYAGAIGAKQDLPVVLDAAERLQGSSGIMFVIAGDGPAKTGLVERYGHLDNVRFLPLQPEERLCELLNLADVHLLPQAAGAADLVLPSKIGGMLASGRPILATAEAGTEIYEFLAGTAVLTSPGEHSLLAKALLKLKRIGRSMRPQAGEALSALSAASNLRRIQTTLAKQRHRPTQLTQPSDTAARPEMLQGAQPLKSFAE